MRSSGIISALLVDRDLAKRDAEALRYRLIVRLALVTREARSQGKADVEALARALRAEVEAIEIAPEEALDPTAMRALLAEVPKIEKLQRDIGLPDHGMRVYPKWLRFAAWTSPALVGIGLVAWIIERRRRKKEVSADQIQRLEEMEQKDE